MTITYQCGECGHEFEISVTPFRPGRTHGPPEQCCPAGGGGFEPDACPGCGCKADEDAVFELGLEEAESETVAAAEARRDAMMGDR